VPAGRRDWVEAVWAEAGEVPPGLQRLAWRTGGVRLIARETLMRRRIGSAVLFAAAAAAAARMAWPGSPASLATGADRVYVITMLGLLAGLPLLARPFLGPAHSRAARLLRAGTWAAFLALIPAEAAVQQFLYTPPRGGADLRLYLLIAGDPPGAPHILVLVILAVYMAAIVWMTSRRSQVAPATLAAGTGAGIALGAVMYAVAPLGLSNEATNPWLPGSDIDPLVLAAWLLLLCGPAAAAALADRRYTASASSPPPARARARQIMAAGLLTAMTGALFVTVAGAGTTALMLKAAWLRNWLYHGQRLLYGVQNLSADLRTLPAIAYSHQITGAVDAGAFFLICIGFPLIALAPTGIGALSLCANPAPGQGDPPPGGGGPPGPGTEPDPQDGSEPQTGRSTSGGILVITS
jgi:hypothetical protein